MRQGRHLPQAHQQGQENFDTNFQGYGRFLTSSTGEFYFRTIKPVPSRGRPAAHIHARVWKGDKKLLTTECFVKGLPNNERDGQFKQIRARDPKGHETLCLDFDPLKGSRIGELSCEVGHRSGVQPRGLSRSVEVARTVGVAPPIGDSETAEPIARVEVRDRSVATSGSSQRGFRIRGTWFSHIFDPRTGQPAGRVVGATVIAERATDANALATTHNVLAVEDGLRMAASIPGIECRRNQVRIDRVSPNACGAIKDATPAGPGRRSSTPRPSS